MPRRRSCCSTIASRSASIGSDADAEVREDGRRDLGDAGDRRVDADREEWNGGVARDERAVAPTARVMTAAEAGELPARRRGHEQLARVWVRDRGVYARRRVGMLELVRAAVCAVAPRDHVVTGEAKRDVDRRLAVERACELLGIGA